MAQTKAQLVVGLNVNASAPATALQIDSSGNVNLDSNTLYVDATNNRVGVGTSSPTSARLDVREDVNYPIRWGSTSAQFGELSYDTGNCVIGATSGNKLTLRSAGTTAITIDTSQRVGVGTTTPNSNLHISSSSNAELRITSGAASQAILRFGNGVDETLGSIRFNSPDDSLQFYGLNDAERMRIDSSGRLLLGTSSSNAPGSLNSKIQVEALDFTGSYSAVRNSADTGGPQLVLGKSRGTALGAKTVVVSGDSIGGINFFGADGTNFIEGASIVAVVDGTPGSNDMPGRLVFSTTADGASSPTEHVRINQAGALKVSSTGTYGGATTSVSEFYQTNNATSLNARCTNASFTDSVFTLDADRNTTNGTYYFARFSCTGVTYRFQILDSGNVQNANGSYTAISDKKLKENIVDANSQWNDIKSIKIRNWNFKEESGQGTHRQIGPIAQELEEVCPGLVFDTPDRDADGNETGEVTKGVNQSVLYMKAVKALQEAMERIETLEAKVAALEGA